MWRWESGDEQEVRSGSQELMGRSGTPGVSPGSAETGPGEPKGRVVNARGHTPWGSPCVPPLGSCSELSGAQGPRAAGRAGPG